MNTELSKSDNTVLVVSYGASSSVENQIDRPPTEAVVIRTHRAICQRRVFSYTFHATPSPPLIPPFRYGKVTGFIDIAWGGTCIFFFVFWVFGETAQLAIWLVRAQNEFVELELFVSVSTFERFPHY